MPFLKGGREGGKKIESFRTLSAFCIIRNLAQQEVASECTCAICKNPVQSEQVTAVEEQGAWLQQASCLFSF